jgi:Zn-finger protein
MPKAKKRLSKGKRRHIRWEKAKRRKEEGKEHKKQLAEERRKEKLPDYFAISLAKQGSSWYEKLCPHCKSNKWASTQKVIKTKQGSAEVRQCNNCHQLYRL